MAVDIGAGGSLGIAFETLAAPGTYVAPTRFIPIENESLMFEQAITKRRPIRGIVDSDGASLGDGSVSGDFKFAAYYDLLPYILYGMRSEVTKSGAGPYTYTSTGAHGAVGAYSFSITVVRNGVAFGYSGCYFSSVSWAIEEGILMCTASVVGFKEASVSVPTAAFTSTGKEFTAGMYSIEYADTATCTVDEIEISIDDGASPEFRLCGDTGADLVVFGERSVSASLQRDFEDRTEYNLFRATTSQKLEFIADNGTQSISFELPVATIDSYEVNLGSQSELVRASIEYSGDYDATTGSGYEIVVVSDEDITVPT